MWYPSLLTSRLTSYLADDANQLATQPIQSQVWTRASGPSLSIELSIDIFMGRALGLSSYDTAPSFRVRYVPPQLPHLSGNSCNEVSGGRASSDPSLHAHYWLHYCYLNMCCYVSAP